MGNEQEIVGRKKVRLHLLDPLNAMGMTRKRSMKVEKFTEMQTRLADRLAYMSVENLLGLRQYLVRLAAGRRGDVWPAEVSILRDAYNLQKPPPRKSNYAQSLIRSAMGQQANDEGWLVELFQIAKRLGPPPSKYIIHRLKDEADQNQRQRMRVAEHIETGRATQDERAWLSRHHADLAECLAIINDNSEKAEA